MYIGICIYIYIYTFGPQDLDSLGLTPTGLTLNPAYCVYFIGCDRRALREPKYGIRFIFSPFYEHSNLEYAHVPV